MTGEQFNSAFVWGVLAALLVLTVAVVGLAITVARLRRSAGGPIAAAPRGDVGGRRPEARGGATRGPEVRGAQTETGETRVGETRASETRGAELRSAEFGALRAEIAQSLRHVAVVRYDAFGDMGGRLSFSAALVDDHGDGLVFSAIHARAESRTYAKGIVNGASDVTLTPEEQRALAAARSTGGRP